jgi:hypothetical protein
MPLLALNISQELRFKASVKILRHFMKIRFLALNTFF